MKKEPAGLKSTNPSPPASKTARNDENDFKFSPQSNYKKFFNLFKESNEPKQKKALKCNYWVCKILDSLIDDKTSTAKYEPYNIVSETGDSIFYDPFLSNIFDNENKLAGEIYIAEDKIRDIVQDELVKHFTGVNFNKNEY